MVAFRPTDTKDVQCLSYFRRPVLLLSTLVDFNVLFDRSLNEEFVKLYGLKRDFGVGNAQGSKRHHVIDIFDRINEIRVRLEVGVITPSYMSRRLSTHPH